jgi:hypothetical protein
MTNLEKKGFFSLKNVSSMYVHKLINLDVYFAQNN